MHARLTVRFAARAALLIALASSPSLAQEPDSLEGLLERARERQAAAVEAIRPEVDRLVKELRAAVVEGRRRPIEAARTNLVRVGPIAAPLLIDHLDPGDPSDPDTRAMAVRVSQVLVATRPRSITEGLLDIVRTGTLEGRLNALRVLGETPEPQRVCPVLVEVYRRTDGPLRRSSLASLAKIGGPDAEALLVEALDDPTGDLAGLALRALAGSQAVAAAPDVLAFVRQSSFAAANAREVIAYYDACSSAMTPDHASALIDLASDKEAATDDRTAILALIGQYPEAVGDDERDRLRAIARQGLPDLSEAALVCLAILGDRNARRELIEPYDDRVAKNKSWAKSYENRGNVLYRIGEYRDAIRDYRKALDLGAADPRARQEEVHIGLARCYALVGKLREAAQTLRGAPITAAEVKALADDPDFAELRASSRYGDVFDVDR